MRKFKSVINGNAVIVVLFEGLNGFSSCFHHSHGDRGSSSFFLYLFPPRRSHNPTLNSSHPFLSSSQRTSSSLHTNVQAGTHTCTRTCTVVSRQLLGTPIISGFSPTVLTSTDEVCFVCYRFLFLSFESNESRLYVECKDGLWATCPETFQTWSSFQTADAGTDRHQQHSLPVSVRRQPLAGGPHGETSHSSASVDEVGVSLWDCSFVKAASFVQDYLGALIVLAAAVASIWSLPHSLLSKSLVGLGLTYALTVRFLSQWFTIYKSIQLHFKV